MSITRLASKLLYLLIIFINTFPFYSFIIIVYIIFCSVFTSYHCDNVMLSHLRISNKQPQFVYESYVLKMIEKMFMFHGG